MNITSADTRSHQGEIEMTAVDDAPAWTLGRELAATAADRPRQDDVRAISQLLPDVLARYGLGFDGSLALLGAAERA
jgi:hypothetical protein